MNFDDIEQVWRSPHNQPSAAQIERDRDTFVSALRRRRRGTWCFLALVSAALTVLTVQFGLQLVRPDPTMDVIDPAREWGAGLVLLLPWVAVLILVRLQIGHARAHPDAERSIGDSVRALLDANRQACLRYRLIMGLNLAMLALIPLVVYQLRAVGKAGNEILVPAFLVFPVLMTIIIGTMAWRYRRKLLPEQRTLEALLRSYQTVRV